MSHASQSSESGDFDSGSEEEWGIEEGTGVIYDDVPRSQSRVQTSPGKKVAFDSRATQWRVEDYSGEQMDADAVDQLQREDRQARNPGARSTRSRSPNKRSVSRVDSHRDLEIIVNQARRSTSRGPAPASVHPREIPGGQMRATSRYPGAADPTPAEHLTPQERKDNELDAEVMETLQKMRSDIHELCTKFFKRDIKKPDLMQMVGDIQDNNDVEFINFCRAIAEGGGDAQTWQQVVAEQNCRFGLSYGIIHRVLVRHVFGSLLFGGPKELMMRLEQMEKAQENEDGMSLHDHNVSTNKQLIAWQDFTERNNALCTSHLLNSSIERTSTSAKSDKAQISNSPCRSRCCLIHYITSTLRMMKRSSTCCSKD